MTDEREEEHREMYWGRTVKKLLIKGKEGVCWVNLSWLREKKKGQKFWYQYIHKKEILKKKQIWSHCWHFDRVLWLTNLLISSSSQGQQLLGGLDCILITKMSNSKNLLSFSYFYFFVKFALKRKVVKPHCTPLHCIPISLTLMEISVKQTQHTQT